MFPISLLDGWKTYIAAIGLAGKAAWEFSQGDYANAYQSLLLALAAFGLRSAVAKLEK